VANRKEAKEWEQFTIYKIKKGNNALECKDKKIHHGCFIALKAINGKFVCAEGGGGREVTATRDQAKEWEMFLLL